MNIIIRLFSDLLIIIFTVYCWNYCLELKIKDSLRKNIILIIILTFIIAITAEYINNPLKIFANFISLIILNRVFISKNLRKALGLTIVSEIIIWISEFSFAVISSFLIKGDIQIASKKPMLFIALNLYVFLISVIILKTKIPRKIYNVFDKSTNTIKNKETIIYSTMIIFIIIISLTESYMKLPISIVLTTNVIMGIIFITITFKMTITKSKLNKIDSKYQTSMNSLEEKELLIDKLRINGHENKNELLTIRNMIKDKKVIAYIDKLIDNKIKDNEKIMKQTSKIPEGGLRATIYTKMCLMDKEKINYQLDIAKNVRTTDLINLDEEVVLNICKILGVFLDNSLEAVKDLEDKNIFIEIYKIDSELFIEITNNFKGNIDIDKISKSRYTTKGENHGYGLALVNKIIYENKSILKNEREINNSNFKQILKIKM